MFLGYSSISPWLSYPRHYFKINSYRLWCIFQWKFTRLIWYIFFFFFFFIPQILQINKLRGNSTYNILSSTFMLNKIKSLFYFMLIIIENIFDSDFFINDFLETLNSPNYFKIYIYIFFLFFIFYLNILSNILAVINLSHKHEYIFIYRFILITFILKHYL